MHHKTVESASPGDNVGINVKAIPKDKRPMGGDVMVVENDPLEKGEQPGEVEEFTATVAVQDHPGQLQAASADGKEDSRREFIRTSESTMPDVPNQWKMGRKLEESKMKIRSL